MIFLKIFFSGFILSIVVCAITLEREKDKKQRKIMNEYIERISANHVERNFVVSEYLSRIEQEYIKIIQEREKKEPYQLVLWIGINGLRLNEDGTSEWIKKKQKNTITYRQEFPDTYQYCNFYPSYISAYTTQYNPYQQFYPMYSLQNCCYQTIGINRQIQQINQNIISLQFQTKQNI